MKWIKVVPPALLLLSVTGTGIGQQTQPGLKHDSAPAPAAAVNPATYVIGAEDLLQVTVWKEPTLSGPVPVRPDGKISLVLIGDMPAAGLTPMQLSAQIKDRLKKYIQDPNVYVVVTAVNSQRIFLVGEVGHVGPVTLTAGMTPLQAIATAGGLTPFASAKHIYILRGAAGKQKKIPFNYKQALKGDGRQDIPLLVGDTIVVP
ncbi:MAG: polysaccharide biosynthesis/export family protein [Acidobacteriaceae bacterium]